MLINFFKVLKFATENNSKWPKYLEFTTPQVQIVLCRVFELLWNHLNFYKNGFQVSDLASEVKNWDYLYTKG